MIPCKWESGADPGIFDRGGVQTLVQKGLLDSFEANYSTPTPTLTVVLLLLVKDAPLEHPPLVFGYKDCTDFVNINVKVMM